MCVHNTCPFYPHVIWFRTVNSPPRSRIIFEPFWAPQRRRIRVRIWHIVDLHDRLRRVVKHIHTYAKLPRDHAGEQLLIMDYRNNAESRVLMRQYRQPRRDFCTEECLPTDLGESIEWLVLHPQERALVRRKGCLVIKGRSGTGKTIIIIRRLIWGMRDALKMCERRRQA